MNSELLLKVKAHILEEPKRLVMGHCVMTKEMGYIQARETETVEEIHFDFAPCGTAACIAGWTLLLEGFTGTGWWEGNQKRAMQLLGIDFKQSDSLFHVSYWPPEFRDAYRRAILPEERAKIAADRIDHFIEQNTPKAPKATKE